MAAVLALPLLTSCDRMLEEKNYGNPTTADLMTKILGRCDTDGR